MKALWHLLTADLWRLRVVLAVWIFPLDKPVQPPSAPILMP
jgi:hypothetical protein